MSTFKTWRTVSNVPLFNGSRDSGEALCRGARPLQQRLVGDDRDLPAIFPCRNVARQLVTAPAGATCVICNVFFSSNTITIRPCETTPPHGITLARTQTAMIFTPVPLLTRLLFPDFSRRFLSPLHPIRIRPRVGHVFSVCPVSHNTWPTAMKRARSIGPGLDHVVFSP